jgi:hypothetical protein
MPNVPGHREMFQGSFKIRSKLRAKNAFWAPQARGAEPPSIQNLVKTNSCRFTIQEPIFSASNQNFKAVTMGAVAAIALFWRVMANPAISNIFII